MQWLDARRVLLVEWGPLGPGVRWEQSRANLQQQVPADFAGVLVVTGFIATDTHGLQTTLGRNGSDFSGAIFAALFAHLFAGERTGQSTWIATAAVMIGIGIAVFGRDASGVGFNVAATRQNAGRSL